MGSISHIMASEDTKNLTTALSARAYGYGYPGVAGAPFAGPMGAMSPHRTAYYGMQEHIKAEERMLEQRRTLYTDLRSAESKEASCVEKRLSDEQITAQAAREAEVKAAQAKAAEAREAEAHLASAVAAEGQSMQDRACKEGATAHFAGYGYGHAGAHAGAYGGAAGYGGAAAGYGYGVGAGRYY